MDELPKQKRSAFRIGYGWVVLGILAAVAIFLVYPVLIMRLHARLEARKMEYQAVLTAQTMYEVGDFLQNQTSAWNHGDLDGFMLGYWNDPELTLFSDNIIEKGYEPLKQRYYRRYKAEGKEMGKLTFSHEEYLGVRNHLRELVVVRGKWKVEKSTETRDGLFTLWVEKKPEGWRIIHDHTSAALNKD